MGEGLVRAIWAWGEGEVGEWVRAILVWGVATVLVRAAHLTQVSRLEGELGLLEVRKVGFQLEGAVVEAGSAKFLFRSIFW